jgi:serine/threonine-protein kinase
MAEVVVARDTTLGRRVALKLLPPALAADPVFVERMRREATAIASLNHPNVVVIYDHGVDDGLPFMAMEYVQGGTLKALITSDAPLAAGTAVGYARQTLDGLESAHAVGIIHRDVKPQNLLVRVDGTLKVADFGVARSVREVALTQHGAVIGTADYIAPEQAEGRSAGAASDIYSVGVVLFEMLTGRLPFSGDLPLAVASQHILTPAPDVRDINPAVPPALARVVERALRKDPSARYDSAAAMQAALAAAMQGDPAPTLVAPPSPDASAATRVLPTPPHAEPTRVAPPAPEPAATRVAPPPLEADAAGPAPPSASPRAARRPGGPRRRRILAALVAGALAVAAIVAVATRGDGGAPLVQLPSVIGKPTAAAGSALRARGFDVRIAAARHGERPSGTVALVQPAGGSAKRGSLITLTPSSGPLLIAIPPVSGISQEAAIAALEQLGFLATPAVTSDAAPAGIVVGTNPAAGTEAPPRSSVTVIVSAGPPVVEPAPPDKAKPPKDTRKGPGHDKKHGKAKEA